MAPPRRPSYFEKPDLFWCHVDISDDDGCWPWTRPARFAVVTDGGRTHLVHRMAWALAHGTFPPSEVLICRTCDNPVCVKPSHLLATTRTERWNVSFRRPLLKRMLGKFFVGDDCWEWIATKDRHGYGRINSGGKSGKPLLAYRVLYEVLVGPVPDGLELDHRCRDKGCVRPSHLEPVTHLENMRRARAS